METPSDTTPRSASGSSGVTDEPPDRVGQVLDLVTYMGATTVLFAVVSAVLAALLGVNPVWGVKYGLFVFGFLAFGFGTVLMMPKRPWKEKEDDVDALFGTPDEFETKFQGFVQRLPPARFRQVPADKRLPTSVRIFLASVLMLAVSFTMEAAFGV